MKPTLFKLGKWSMTTIAALILSACGSSGDDAPSTKGQTTPNNGASTSSTPSKENYALKAANALKEAQAAKMEADKAAATGDVAAAQAAVAKAQAAANAAQEAAVKANNDKDPNAPAAVSAAQQAAEALQTLANAVADAQKVADQKLAENQKQDNTLKATQALEAAKAAQAAAEKAVATGDVAAAKAAAEKAKAAVEAAKAVAGKDTKATDLQTLAQQAADALKAVENAVAEAQKVADQKLAQDTANESITVSTVPVNNKASNVGYKHVAKTESDFILNGIKKPANSEANTGLLMQEQDPNKNLDTFVIGHYRHTDGKEHILYLQDVDTRAMKALPAKDDNEITLEQSWVAKKGVAYPALGARITGKHLVDVTKVEKQGTEKDKKALVYSEGKKIYIHSGTDEAKIKDSGLKGVKVLTFNQDGVAQAPVDFTGTKRTDTVFELYGNQTTFAQQGDSPEKYNDANAQKYKNAKNLPLEDKVLNYVQYGRVTSQLSGRNLKDYIDGLHQNYATKIVPFGEYGQSGTENHYFSRGVNNTTADQLAALPAYYGTNQLTYKGHVVDYGLDHTFRQGNNTGKVPTALGGSAKEYLISGTHIQANVDLTTKLVDGNVYNIWGLVKNNDFDTLTKVEAPLVGFNGTLADNGNIAGTAQNYTQNYAPGVFNATIFGAKGEEMGGTIVSSNPDKVKWGLSFGAKNTTTPPAVKPLAPPPVKPIGNSGITGTLDGSDQKGLTNLVK